MIPLEEIRRARERIGDDVLRTPLVPLGRDDRILLKLECLHPIGSFKVRGAFSAIRAASASELANGVVTASAGNMAQGLAWAAREAGVPARVIVPWGGGGLTIGIASALKALRPDVRVVTAEPETGAPLAAAFAAGEPREIEFTPSWVDGAGGRALLPGMWEQARELVDEAVVVPLPEVEEAVRLLASRAHVVAEGAGALALAAALRRDDRCVCIVSGGNIDPDVYAGILSPAATA